ncbi:hypothetical protein [Dokdonia sp.]|uniref:hypothetical protein n=1 Tax=Dokdonia sp. TaxID=2024995 RepID=UPI00326552AE
MKKLIILSIAIITLHSCSSDSDEFQPNLSFNIESGSRIASSEINITNTTTNQNGGYIWEVISDFGVETFTSQNLNFNANRIGDYTIRLRSNQFDIQTEQAITITRPSSLLFNTLTLKDIPQNYNSLYFRINKLTLNGTSYTYTSQTRQNISSIVPSATDWTIDFPGNTIQLNNGSNANNTAVYQIEFYDENDNLVTKMNSFGDTYFDSNEFIAGEEVINTTTIGCSNCDFFEIIAEFSFQ